MARSVSKIDIVKASTDNPSGNPPPVDKTLGIDTYIKFYEIEYGDKTDEGEEL